MAPLRATRSCYQHPSPATSLSCCWPLLWPAAADGVALDSRTLLAVEGSAAPWLRLPPQLLPKITAVGVLFRSRLEILSGELCFMPWCPLLLWYHDHCAKAISTRAIEPTTYCFMSSAGRCTYNWCIDVIVLLPMDVVTSSLFWFHSSPWNLNLDLIMWSGLIQAIEHGERRLILYLTLAYCCTSICLQCVYTILSSIWFLYADLCR